MQDPVWAKIWLDKAARQGHVEAKAALEQLEVSLGEAIEPLALDRAEAEGGAAAAQCRRVRQCMGGIGVEKDEAAGAEWYRKAAEQGHAEGQRPMGRCRMDAGDRAESVVWLKSAAEGGDAEGQYLLAVCYQKGMGTEKDPAYPNQEWLAVNAELRWSSTGFLQKNPR